MGFIKIICLCLLTTIFISTFAFSQSSIRGNVIDLSTGESLIGAVVMIEQSGAVVVTDLDGNFILKDVPKGVYDLRCSYVGYKTARLIGVIVKEDGVKLAYFQMEDGIEADIVPIVTADAAKHLEKALLAQRKKSDKILEAISSQEIFRLGDQNVSQAIRRLAGVTIEKDRYVYVRGLGGRYVKMLINGVEIAQSDLRGASLNLSMFSSSILDNITVYRSYSADFGGSFAGGAIEINTKAGADQFSVGLSVGIGYNTLATFSPDFLTFDLGGKVADAIGMNSVHRELPDITNTFEIPRSPDLSLNSYYVAISALKGYTQAFDRHKFEFLSGNPFLNTDLNFHISNKIETKRNKGFRYNLVLGAHTSDENYNSGNAGIYRLDSLGAPTLSPILKLSDHSSTHHANWTVLLNLGFKPSSRTMFRLDANANKNSLKNARMVDGASPGLAAGQFFTSRLWDYQRFRNSNLHFSGNYQSEDGQYQTKWSVGMGETNVHQPNLMVFMNTYSINEQTAEPEQYRIDQGYLPGHYNRDISEIILPLYLQNKIRLDENEIFTWGIGGAYTLKFKNFSEKRYLYDTPYGNSNFDGDVVQYLSDDNLIYWDGSASDVSSTGVYIYDATQYENNFKGDEHIGGIYSTIKADWTKQWTTLFGVRYEQTVNEINNVRLIDSLQVLNNYGSFLPSISLNYRPSDKMVCRIAYSNTIARPTFRELTPFAFFDYLGDFQIKGNPQLQPVELTNADLRWEFFPELREVIAVGAFYKNLQNPIVPKLSDGSLVFQNDNVANLFGVEFEFRKYLGFLGKWAEHLHLNTNFAYTFSAIGIDEDELSIIRSKNPEALAFRPLTGQAPFVVNAVLEYGSTNEKTKFSLGFNVSGRRLVYILEPGTPDIYELPRLSLDVTWVQQLHKNLKFVLNAKNLLNARVQQAQIWNNINYFYRDFPLGQIFNLSFSYSFSK